MWSGLGLLGRDEHNRSSGGRELRSLIFLFRHSALTSGVVPRSPEPCTDEVAERTCSLLQEHFRVFNSVTFTVCENYTLRNRLPRAVKYLNVFVEHDVFLNVIHDLELDNNDPPSEYL